MNITLTPLLYFMLVLVTFALEVGVRHIHFLITETHYKEHHFTISKYLLSIIFPFLSIFIIYLGLGSSVLYIFLASAALGAIAEWVIGWWFNKVMGVRLWTYHKYSIGAYTSFLSIPLWGVVGVLLFLVVKLFEN